MGMTPRQKGRSVGFGVDQIVENRFRLPQDGRFGLLTNDAALTASDPALRSRVALQRARINLVRLFSPEHGMTADVADGAPVPHGYDSYTDLKVVSLYGDNIRPTRDMLSGLDGMLVDLPDIGTRYYTYIWTMSHVLKVCAEVDLPLWILDRPNPIGGDLSVAEGPLLDESRCDSLVGRFAIPIRHCLTIGELARLWNCEYGWNAKLDVVPAYDWKRSDHHPSTKLRFVSTSPAIPTYDSALLYPGTCLFEATNISVGRGTALPFQQVGAPWLDADRLRQRFMELQLPGIMSNTVSFTPQIGPYQGELCKGVQLVITDQFALRPVAMGFSLLNTVITQSREDFEWSRYPTTANPLGEDHFERLIGVKGIADVLSTQRESLATEIRNWTTVPNWTKRAAPHLCYS